MKQRNFTVETRGFEEVCLCRGRLVGRYLKGDRLLINHSDLAERTARHKTLKPYGTSAGVLKSNLLRFAPIKSGFTPKRSPLPAKGPRDFGKGAPHGAYLEIPLGPATGKELDSMRFNAMQSAWAFNSSSSVRKVCISSSTWMDASWRITAVYRATLQHVRMCFAVTSQICKKY